jgi:DNA helicase IV
VDKETIKAQEQAYFDRAYDAREAMRDRLGGLADAAAHPAAAAELRDFAEHAGRAMRGPGSPVAFGRMDTDEDETWYVGYHAIWDDRHDVLVVNWQAPVADRYYTATPNNPQGLLLRRDFDTEGNKIVDFVDIWFAELAEDVERLTSALQPSDALLEDLARHRTGEMQDIVRTIQHTQYELVRAPLDQLLVIQGGPGTGKTAVALHRVSWLLFNERQRLSPGNMMVVGPNPTFIRYIQKVLPGLGDENVRQTALTGLVRDVRFGAHEPPELAKLKGDPRMMGLVERGLQDRITYSTEPLTFDVGTRTVSIETTTIGAQLDRLRNVPFNVGRQQLREFIREEVVRGAGLAPERDGQIDSAVDRIWPSLTAQAFVRELYGSERRLITAAGNEFTAAEVRSLHRQAQEKLSEEVWTDADAAVLDYAAATMIGPPATQYEHIVVDEAQDLSPMELAMIARRSSRGSMTILGDVAQSAGGWARSSWDDVIDGLVKELPAQVEELAIGYRVPRQIFEFAAQLLPHIAPDVAAPTIVRDGPDHPFPPEPALVRVPTEELPEAVVDAATKYTSHGFAIGVIVPDSLRQAVDLAFADAHVNTSDAKVHGLGGPISIVAPFDCRGLEFDAVVVVEPEAIALEQIQGHRLLYVALTRSTQYLTVVYSGQALPIPSAEPPPTQLETGGAEAAEAVRTPTSRDERAVDAFAAVLAEEVRAALQPELWDLFARKLAEALEEDPRSDSDG